MYCNSIVMFLYLLHGPNPTEGVGCLAVLQELVVILIREATPLMDLLEPVKMETNIFKTEYTY